MLPGSVIGGDMKRIAGLLRVAVAVTVLGRAVVLSAQVGGPDTGTARAQIEAEKDPLGRETPRGTLLGFMRAARDGNEEVASQYLNTAPPDSADLAHNSMWSSTVDCRLASTS